MSSDLSTTHDIGFGSRPLVPNLHITCIQCIHRTSNVHAKKHPNLCRCYNSKSIKGKSNYFFPISHWKVASLKAIFMVVKLPRGTWSLKIKLFYLRCAQNENLSFSSIQFKQKKQRSKRFVFCSPHCNYLCVNQIHVMFKLFWIPWNVHNSDEWGPQFYKLQSQEDL